MFNAILVRKPNRTHNPRPLVAWAAVCLFFLWPATASGQQPDWSVDPAAFENSASVTAVLSINGVESSDPGDIIAAFSGEEVRGVATPTLFNGRQFFFMTVYLNSADEKLSLQAYLSLPDRVLPLDDSLDVAPNTAEGSLNAPLVLRTQTEAGCIGGQPDWQFNPAAFETNMSLTTRLFIDGVDQVAEGDMLAAFSGEELRGLASPTFVSGTPYFFLTIYGEGQGSPISFQYFDAALQRVANVSETLAFESNSVVGSLSEPQVLNAGCNLTSTGIESADAQNSLDVLPPYPNPFKQSTTISYHLATPQNVEIQVYNLLGKSVFQQVRGTVSQGAQRFQFTPEDLPAGVYFYNINTGSRSHTGKLVYMP